MDNEHARLILRAYRPSGEDAAVPFFQEALQQARLDPELGRWFAEQIRFDQSIQNALRAETPPPGLRDSLLQAHEIANLHRRSRSIFRRTAWKQPSSWMALAAAVALLLGIGALLRPGLAPSAGPMTKAQFVEASHRLRESNQISLGKMGSDTDALRAWLGGQRAPHDFPIPPKLAEFKSLGCQAFTINGSKVSLICFTLDPDRMVHLFVIDAGALKDAPGTTPSILRDGARVAATWTASGKTYLLLGVNVGEETLLRLI